MIIHDITRKYKPDIFFMLLLVIIFILSATLLGYIYGDLFMDCGREAYLPELILQGKVLYKDIFGMYNPLSYQINALLYLLFGAKLSTLYCASYFNALMILIGLYFICRIFINEFYSFTFCTLISGYFIFGSVNLISYIFPYSYAYPYACCCFIYSTLFFLYFMKNEKLIYLILSALLLGFSFANKPEYVVCIIPILIFFAINKKSIKVYLLYILLFLIPVLISYGILFIQGFTLNDLLNYIKFNKSFFSTPEQIYYTINAISSNWDIENIQLAFENFKSLLFYCIFGSIYFSLFSKNKYLMIFGLLISPFAIDCTISFLKNNYNVNLFSWVTIGLLIVIYIKKAKFETMEDKMLFFLAVSGIFSMFRINFFPLNKWSYGIYSITPILAVWIYFIKYNIEYFKNIQYKKYVALALILLSLSSILCIKKNYASKLSKLTTAKGTLYSSNSQVLAFSNALNWVSKNTKKSESVLMIPEGIMLNFMTERPTKEKYYHLIPNHITTLGENNVVNGLSSDKPDYIIINNTPYNMYGSTEICKNFGLEICSFVEKNYNLLETYSSIDVGQKALVLKIYKSK